MRVKFNMSMTNGRANGVEIYSIKLRDEILRIEKDLKKDFWYIKRTKLLALYRIFWNFFILPFKAKKNLFTLSLLTVRHLLKIKLLPFTI